MAIPSTAIATPIVAPMFKLQWMDDKGMPTKTAQQFFQQIYDFVVSMNRIVPCNCANVGNIYTLTQLSVAPLITQYNDYDMFSFVASATSTGLVTANVVTSQGTLATLNVYKTNGSAQATTGDITIGLHYLATYVNSLNAGAGGFVLR